jgi:hypothetical protein
VFAAASLLPVIGIVVGGAYLLSDDATRRSTGWLWLSGVLIAKLIDWLLR